MEALQILYNYRMCLYLNPSSALFAIRIHRLIFEDFNKIKQRLHLDETKEQIHHNLKCFE